MAAQYDLTPKMVPFLDRHLACLMVRFLKQQTSFYEKSDLVQAEKTLMQDIDKSEDAKLRVEALKAKVHPLLDRLEETESCGPETLKQLNITTEEIDRLYEYGQAVFNCGPHDFKEASRALSLFYEVSASESKRVSALWGILAAKIREAHWQNASETIKALRRIIDDDKINNDALYTVQQRAWLAHWSLFVLFFCKESRHEIMDMLFSHQYINAIQTLCPWILRYMVVAVVAFTHRKNQMRELVKIIEQETYQYKDPVTEFIEALYIRFDLDDAQKRLKECEEVLKYDFFMQSSFEAGDVQNKFEVEFLENARKSISETYCRIHQKINIKDMSRTLNLNEEEGEKWIVGLIQDTRQDAKIDLEENTVIMSTPVTSVYQQVIERIKNRDRTKNLTSRPVPQATK